MKQEILIAIIASSSALGGVIISQAFSLLRAFLDKRHEKQKVLRQKYEEMMFYFSASLEWIQHLNGSTSLAEISSLSQSADARKALSLCLLYFPDLSHTANNYILAQQSYFKSIITLFREGVNAAAGAQALVHDEKNHTAATNNLFSKKNIFENLIVSKTNKYTQA